MGKFKNVVQVVRRGHTLYRARLSFPFDPELGCKPTPKDFYAATEREADRKRSDYKPEQSLTDKAAFTTFLLDEFLPYQESRYRNGELSWTRCADRKSRIHRFILAPAPVLLHLAKARIRKVALGKLTPAIMEEFFRALEGDSVGAITRDKLRNDLRLALRLAKRRIPSRIDDYFEDVRVTKPPRQPRSLFGIDQVLTAINNQAKPLFARALVSFELTVQCRPSEMFALRWSDVDLEAGTVRFGKAMRRTAAGYEVTNGTKTGERGVRMVPLGSTLTQTLRSLQLAATSQENDEDGYIFTWQGKRGPAKPLNKDRLRYAWAEVRNALELPEGPDFYSLKHLGNSFALRSGVDIAAQAKKMGHTTTRMASNDYREVFGSELVAAAAVFEVAHG